MEVHQYNGRTKQTMMESEILRQNNSNLDHSYEGMPSEQIVYKNVRKANLPATADIAYCEIRITELMADVDHLRQRCAELESEQDRYVTFAESINQVNDRNSVLMDENKQLQAMLKTKIRELEQAKARIQIGRQDDGDELQKALQLQKIMEKENQMLMTRYSELEKKYTELRNLELINLEQLNQIKTLTSDVDIWKDRNKKSEQEREKLMDQLATIKQQLDEPIKNEKIIKVNKEVPQPVENKFKDQFYQLSTEMQELKTVDLEKDHKQEIQGIEIKRLLDQLSSKDEIVMQLQAQLSKLQEQDSEINMLKNVLQERPKPVVQIVEKLVEVEKPDSDVRYIGLQKMIDQLNLQVEKFRIKNEQLQQKIDVNDKLIAQFQRDLRQVPKLNEQIEVLTLDKNNLQVLLKQREFDLDIALTTIKEKQIVIQQLEQLKFEISLQQEQNIRQQAELLDLRQKLSTLELENLNISRLEGRLAEGKKAIEKLKDEILKATEALKVSQQQVFDLQIQLNGYKCFEGKYKSQVEINKHLRKQLEEANGQSEQWRAKFNQNASEVMRLQKLVETHQKRQQILTEEVIAAQKEIVVPNVTVNAVAQIERIDKVTITDSTKIQELKNNIITLQLQIESNNRNKIFVQNDFQRQIDGLQAQLSQMRSECKLWKEKFLQSDQENTHYTNQNTKFQDLKSKYESQQFLIKSLNEKLKQSTGQTSELKAAQFKLQLKVDAMELLQQQSDKLRDQVNSLLEENGQLQGRIPKLFQQVIELERQKILLERPQAVAQVTSSESEEVMRRRLMELENQLDNGKDDLIEQLSNRIKIVEKELQKQVEQNGQLVKEIQNTERKRQDISVELQLLQMLEVDSKKLRGQYVNKVKEADSAMMQVARSDLIVNTLQQQKDSMQVQEFESKNQIKRLLVNNQNQDVQISRLLQQLTVLEQQNSNLKQTIEQYPELQDRLRYQTQQLEELNGDNSQLYQQVDELQAKLSQSELKYQKLLPLAQQIDQLRENNDDKQREILMWQQKLQELDSQRFGQIEELRHKYDLIQVQIKNTEELEDIIKQQEYNLEVLNNEVNKLTQQNKDSSNKSAKQYTEIAEKDIEIRRLLPIEVDFRRLQELYQQEIQKNQDLADKFHLISAQLDEAKRENERLENKTAMMASEVERLQVMVKNKNQGLESQKHQLVQYQQQLDYLQPVVQENKRLIDELDQSFRVIEDLKTQIVQLNKQLDELKTQLANSEQNSSQLYSSIEQMQHNIRGKDDEQSQMLTTIRSMENHIKDVKRDDSQWSDVQAEIQKLHEDLNFIHNQLEQKLQENDDLQKQNHALQSQLLDNQKLEFEALEQTLTARDTEIDEWRRRFSKVQQDLEKLYGERLIQENKMGALGLEIERWKRKSNSTQGETTSLRGIIDQLNVEIERLNQHIVDVLKENEDWRIRYATLQQEIPGLVQILPSDGMQPYQITPGNSFRIPPGQSNNEGRRSARRSHTLLRS